MKPLRSLALLPLAWFVACGGDSDFSSGGDGDAVAFDELPASLAAAECELFERCLGPLDHIFFTLEDCKTSAEARYRDGFDALEAAVEAKTVTYDGKKAAACLDMLSKLECTEVNQRTIEACEDAFAGTVPLGNDCKIDEECTGSTICEVVADQCPGQCVERYTAGHACSESDECADGLVCSEATSRCVAPAANGEACGGGVEPQCDGGFLCAGETEGTTGTCRPLDEIEERGAGEECSLTVGELCEEGLSCVLQTGFTFVCRAIPAPGGTCGIGLPEHCPAGEYCPISDVQLALDIVESNCVPLPAIGEPCAARPFEIGADCEAYARCDTTTGMCLGLRGLGESCSSDELCTSGNCENGGCAPLRACL